MGKILTEKLKESLQAVLPIGLIILALHVFLVPMPTDILILMASGMSILIVGLTLFSLGTDIAMMPMGEHIGSALLNSKNLLLLIGGCLVFGFIVTIAEPDLQVMANQVPSVPSALLLVGIAAGVGVFLVLAVLRVLLRVRLSFLLIVMYAAAFVIARFSPGFLPVAFDASAVTTGPVTVPFLLALGAGISAVDAGKGSDDNFGICAICSVGPILAVLVIGLFFDPQNTAYEIAQPAAVQSLSGILRLFAAGSLHAFRNVVMVVVPIVGIFAIFQATKLKLSKTELIKIGVGILYLLFGLTIFLTGADTGFVPAGRYLGEAMGALTNNWILVPVCLAVGACVVVAEPAVHVLTKQVEEITSGAISRRTLLLSMAAGVGLAMSISMARMLLGISFWWIVLPGYVLASALTFFVPPFFVGIGFDSGGVAAGAMSATFVLPFTIGVSKALGGTAMDAFGAVGLISMMPPITLQLLGVAYSVKLKKSERAELELLERLSVSEYGSGEAPQAEVTLLDMLLSADAADFDDAARGAATFGHIE